MKDTKSNLNDEARITEALDEMRREAGENFSLVKVNLAELERRTGVSRAKLRRLKENGFEFKAHSCKDRSDGLHGHAQRHAAQQRHELCRVP